MSNPSAKVRLTGICFFLCLACPVFGQAREDQTRAGKVIREAWLAATAGLVSGHGEGIFEYSHQKPGQDTPVVLQKARVVVHFDRGRSKIEVNYELDTLTALKQRITMSDDSVILTNSFGPRIQPLGSSARILKRLPGQVDTPSRNFPFNPSTLPAAIWLVEPFFKRHGDRIRIEKLDSGGFAASAEQGQARFRLVALPQYGFNLRSVTASAGDEPEPVDERYATWAESKGIWYVKSIEVRDRYPNGFRARCAFTYTSFSPNAMISPDLLRVDALQVPVDGLRKPLGAWVVDLDRDAKARTYLIRPAVDSDEKKSEKLIDQLIPWPELPPR